MKSLFKSFSVYLITSIVSAGLSLILTSYLSNKLSPEDFGLIGLFNTYSQFLIPIIGLSAMGYFSIDYYQNVGNKHYLRNIFSIITFLPIILSFFIFIIFYIIQIPLSQLLEFAPHWILVIPIFVLLSVSYDNMLEYFIITKNKWKFSIVLIGKSLIEFAIVIVLVGVFFYKWEGRVIGALVVVGCGFLFYTIYFYKVRLLNFSFNWKIFKNIFSFGWPLIFHGLSKIVLNYSDRIFLLKMCSIEDVGYYNLGYQFGMIELLVLGALMKIYRPFVLEKLSKIDINGKYEIVKITYFLIGILLFLLIGIAVFVPIYFSLFIGEEFSNSIEYVFWIALSYVFWGGYLFFSIFLFHLKKTKVLSLLSLFTLCLNLFLNYLLIINFGAIGVAYATVISFFVVFLIVCIISIKKFKMPWIKGFVKIFQNVDS